MAGRKKSVNRGRHKKKKEISWDDFTREELIKIAEHYKKNQEEKKKKNKMQEARSLRFTIMKTAYLFELSRSGLYKNRYVSYKSHRNPVWEQIIRKSFYNNHKIYGRKRLAIFIWQTYKIRICPRTVGNYMRVLNLKFITRQVRKQKEKKSTQVKFKNLVMRNYNAKNVIATDVSYIAIKSNKTNHAYLSIAINHHTKQIENWVISEFNDDNLAYNTLKSLETNHNTIVHSDHGLQYSSYKLLTLAKEKGYQISMSRIGNCLDNREAEYFFNNLKSECLSQYDTRKLNISELRKIIANYIEWYNHLRIQSILDWTTPDQFKMQSTLLA